MNEAEALTTIKEHLELNDGELFWFLLKEKKNHHLLTDLAKRPDKAFFTADIKTISYSNDVTCNTHISNDGDSYYEFIFDIGIDGTLDEENNKGFTFSSKQVHLQLTTETIFFRDFPFNRDDIHLLNGEQKSLLLFYKYYEKEIVKVNHKLIFETTFKGQDAFVFFTKIWKHVDSQNQTMVVDSSHDFFDELVECHRNIGYSVCCANIWGRYRTPFNRNFYYFKGTKVFPVEMSYYDNRFLFYVENAVEEIYTFYEKLTYLYYLFTQPTSLDKHSLSFQRVFERKVKNELKAKFPQLGQDVNFDWFSKRCANEHRKLSGYRHPLNHYQTSNTFIKGSYSASIKRLRMQLASGPEEELIKLDKDVQNIQKFINLELHGCREAFKRMILLIEELDVAPTI